MHYIHFCDCMSGCRIGSGSEETCSDGPGMHVCVCVCVCMYVCMHSCIFLLCVHVCVCVSV